jgi:hypothetical protein
MAPLSCPSMWSFRPTSQPPHLAKTGTSLSQMRQKQIVRMPAATSRSLLQSRDTSASFMNKLLVIKGGPRSYLASPAPPSHGTFVNWSRNESMTASNRAPVVPRSSTNNPIHCVAVSQVSKLFRTIKPWESMAAAGWQISELRGLRCAGMNDGNRSAK